MSRVWPKSGGINALRDNVVNTPVFANSPRQGLVFQPTLKTLDATTPFRISESDNFCELLMVQARDSNTAVVRIWMQTIDSDANAGAVLAPGDLWTHEIDNRTWEIANIVSHMTKIPNMFPRQALNSYEWFVQTGTATQHIDIIFGYGQAQ